MDNNNANDTKVTSIAVEKGRQGITVHEGGGISIDGPDAVSLYRLIMIKSGMEFEIKTGGMRLTGRAPSCFTIAKRDHNLKGNKEKIYRQFCAMHGFEMKTDLDFTKKMRR